MARKQDDDDHTVQFSSPPCYMHEVDPVYMGLIATDSISQTLSKEDLANLGNAVLYGIPDALVFSDLEGVIRFWNGGAERIFGFSREEALCQSLDIIIPERLRERHWDGYHRMMKTGQSRHKAHEVLSVPALTKSGETLSIQFTVAAVTNAEGALSGIVALLRDATATYEEIKRLRTAK